MYPCSGKNYSEQTLPVLVDSPDMFTVLNSVDYNGYENYPPQVEAEGDKQ